MWVKNQLGHDREVRYHPNGVRLNFRGHLGGQMGETAQTKHFRQHRCVVAHDFGGGPRVQAFCGLKIDRGMTGRLGIVPA